MYSCIHDIISHVSPRMLSMVNWRGSSNLHHDSFQCHPSSLHCNVGRVRYSSKGSTFNFIQLEYPLLTLWLIYWSQHFSEFLVTVWYRTSSFSCINTHSYKSCVLGKHPPQESVAIFVEEVRTWTMKILCNIMKSQGRDDWFSGETKKGNW